MRRLVPTWLGALLAALALVVAGSAVAPAASATGNPGGGGNGTVLGSLPLHTPVPARATGLAYRTTDVAGRSRVVTGTVFVPSNPPPGPLRLIAYAPGTQGMADRCAPSRQFAAGTEYETPFVSALVAKGYAVAVTDYVGLGTPGRHTYVNRVDEAHALLDVARAARNLHAGIPANGPVATAGYSQGGGASAAAAELAPTYAPDVPLVGAYAGAVPADLAAVAGFLDGNPSAGLVGYALNGFDQAYPELRIPDRLNALGTAFLHDTDQQCVLETLPRYPGLRSQLVTRDGSSLGQILAQEPYRSRVEQQRIGTIAPKAPVYVAHSVADDIVPFAQDAAMARSWCTKGARVTFAPQPTPGHVATAVGAFPGAVAFLDAAFAGHPPAPTC